MSRTSTEEGGNTGYKFYLVCEPSGFTHVSISAPTRYVWREGTFIDLTYQIGDLPLVQDTWHPKQWWQLNSAYLKTTDLRGGEPVQGLAPEHCEDVRHLRPP